MQTNWCQYWMQLLFLHPKCFRVPQKMHAKLILSFRCRQIVASIGCSLILCIQSNWSPYNYRKKKAKINKGIYAFKLTGSFDFTQTVAKDWMQHHALHPKCFKQVSSMSSVLAFFEVKKPLTGSCLHILSFTTEPGQCLFV